MLANDIARQFHSEINDLKKMNPMEEKKKKTETEKGREEVPFRE